MRKGGREEERAEGSEGERGEGKESRGGGERGLEREHSARDLFLVE